MISRDRTRLIILKVQRKSGMRVHVTHIKRFDLMRQSETSWKKWICGEVSNYEKHGDPL